MNNLDVLEQLMGMAKNSGVEADAIITHTDKKSVAYRMSKLEASEYSSETNLCLRVVVGKKHAVVATNQLSNLAVVLDRAVAIAKASIEDPYVSLPKRVKHDETEMSSFAIFDSVDISEKDLIDSAQIAEEAALSFDKVTNSEGAFSEHAISNTYFANTNDFFSCYRKSSFYNSISVIAKDKNSMEQGSDYSLTCNLADLKNPEIIGKNAASKAVSKLNPRKVKTCKVPVIFDSCISGSLLQSFARAVNGVEVSNSASFLANKMQKQIFNKSINIIDDPLMAKGICSYPFDDEGELGQELLLVKNGDLNNLILDTHSANKLNLNSNGHASRSKDGRIKPSQSNLYMESGKFSPQKLISQIKRGVMVVDVFGMGANIITGDYSQGASGFWIEDGEISYPVNEFTIASNMQDMFMNMLPANDLSFDKLINAPTLVIAEMTIAGR